MSEIKVNKISPRSGTTVTLGDSGDTFTIPSGATINNQGTATNFGATGSASWTTTVKTNSDSGFTAVAGEGYFLNTTAGTISVNLPAGTAGAVVAFKDYAGTWDTNAVTLVQNGSDKIGGSTENASLSTEGIAVTLVFIDSTQGWLVTDDGLQSVADTNPYMIATGGTVTCSGNCKIHTFTGPGTFTVSKAATCAANNLVSYMVVAGGAGGGGSHDSPDNRAGGGGGSGGYREVVSPSSPYSGSPLNGYPSSPNRITVTATAFPITVGAGGTGGVRSTCSAATNGSNSIFSTITSAGGGSGGTGIGGPSGISGCGADGGSGGGGSGGGSGTNSLKGDGNTPPTSPAQGFDGGAGSNPHGASGGGGGATAIGANACSSDGGAGGAGATSSINATPTARAGGGGGAGASGGGASGGTGGGGAGGSSNQAGTAGTVNTGGGAGGAGFGPQSSPNSHGGAGGSGIVIIRYRFQ